MSKLKLEMEELQKQEDEWKRKEDELRKKEKVCSERPNISSIVHLHGWEQMPIKYSLSPQWRFGENHGRPHCMWLKNIRMIWPTFSTLGK